MKKHKNPLTRLFDAVQAVLIPVSAAKLALMAAAQFIPQTLAMAVELLPEEVLELPNLLSLNAPKVLEVWLLIWQWAEYGLLLIIVVRILLWLLRNAVDLVLELGDRLKVLGCRVVSFIHRLQVVDLTLSHCLYVDIWENNGGHWREKLINIKEYRDYTVDGAHSLRYQSDTKAVQLLVNGKPYAVLSPEREIGHGQLYFRLLTH